MIAPLAVVILSLLCRHCIDPFSSGGSALKFDWTKGSGLSELMPSLPQLVDLNLLHHVTPASLSPAGLLTQSDSRLTAISKRRSLAKGASVDGTRRQRSNTVQCPEASQLLWALPGPRGGRLRGIPEAPFALVTISNADSKFAL